MLTLLLICLLLSNAVTIKRDKSILYSRIVIKGLLLTSFLAYNNLYIKSLEIGIGVYGGLFNVTAFTQSFNIFILIISALTILTLTELLPVNVYFKHYSLVNLVRKREILIPFVTSILIFVYIKGPAGFICLQLDAPWLYYIICGIAGMLSCTISLLLLEKEVYKTIKLISLGLLCISIASIFHIISLDFNILINFILSVYTIPISSNGHSSIVSLYSSSNSQASGNIQQSAGSQAGPDIQAPPVGQASGSAQQVPGAQAGPNIQAPPVGQASGSAQQVPGPQTGLNQQGGPGLQAGAGNNALPGMLPGNVMTPVDASTVPRANLLFTRGYLTNGASNREAGRMMANHLLHLRHINLRAGNNVITPEMTTWLYDWSLRNDRDFHDRLFSNGDYPRTRPTYWRMRNTQKVRNSLWNLP